MVDAFQDGCYFHLAAILMSFALEGSIGKLLARVISSSGFGRFLRMLVVVAVAASGSSLL